ncbi:MAG TPA: hypothetical protein VN203_19300, partial [Candidatus Acidoferrum sp.]|nr:hypothetical protein [Candidatus Acidoferrum sp.]
IAFLAAIEGSGLGEQERVRKRKVIAALEESAGQAAARQVRVPRPPAHGAYGDFPKGIALLSEGRLEIRFGSAEDLLARVVDLVTSATRDFAAFRGTYERKQ